MQELSRDPDVQAAEAVNLSAPLRRPAFRRLAITFTLNELADWMALIALAILVFDRTDSALATTALFLGTRFLPALLGPALVVRAERTPPRIALPVLYGAEAAAFVALALLVDHFSLAAVIAIAMVDGTLALAGRSLTRAVVATLLTPAGELRSGNAILNMGFTGGAAIGPALAGVLVGGFGEVFDGFGVETTLFIGAAIFLLMAGVMSSGPLPHAEPEEGRWRTRLRAGVDYVRERIPLRRLFMAQGAVLVFFAAVIPIEVIYAKETLGADDAGYGALLACWGIGMVLGSVVFAGQRRRGLPVLLLYSTIAVGVAYLGMAAAPTLILACAASVIGGLGNGIQWVSIVSAIQEMTRTAMQARVMSVLESIAAALPGAGYVLGGVVAATLDPRATFWVAGIGVLVVVAAAVRALGGSAWTESSEFVPPDEIESPAPATVSEGHPGVTDATTAARGGND